MERGATWRRILSAASLAGLAILAAACASAPRATIESRLAEIGVPPEGAACMAGELSDRLSRNDLRELAAFTESLTRANSPGAALDALLQIDNPRAVAAIGRSGLACLLAS